MRLSITVDGELVRKGLQDLEAEIPKIGRQQIRTVVNRIVRRMQVYPPEPAHRTRVSQHATLGTIFTKTGRTGRLFRSWAVLEIKGKGYAVENRAAKRGKEYARYVVGDAYGTGQAWMHKGRWMIYRDVVDEEVEKLPKPIAEQIVMVARRKGFEAKETNV